MKIREKYLEKWQGLKKRTCEQFRNGSFTVEAAMIMGVVLFAIMTVLYGTRIVYNRALLTAHAYEYAITGRESGIAGLWGATDEKIDVELEELKPVSFLRKSQIIIEEVR